MNLWTRPGGWCCNGDGNVVSFNSDLSCFECHRPFENCCMCASNKSAETLRCCRGQHRESEMKWFQPSRETSVLRPTEGPAAQYQYGVPPDGVLCEFGFIKAPFIWISEPSISLSSPRGVCQILIMQAGLAPHNVFMRRLRHLPLRPCRGGFRDVRNSRSHNFGLHLCLTRIAVGLEKGL